jgi:predicted alpha/beta-hydrolase family hydrolase
MNPDAREIAGLLLTPGAGGGADQHTLLALEAALDIKVRRVKVPQRAPNAAAVNFVAKQTHRLADDLGVATNELAIGGRSFGGRVCSMAAAEGLDIGALALLSYPLHPPGKPDTARVDHFPQIVVPCLFVSGTRDPFGKPEEFDAHVGTIGGRVTTHWLEGGTHAPKPSFDNEIARVARDWLVEFRR